MEFKKYNWIYRVDNNCFEIIPDEKSKKPEPTALFKYYNLNNNSVDAIINNYIYASHPKQLNDPIDSYCRLIQINDINSIIYILKGIKKPEYIKKEWHKDRKAFIQKVQFNYSYRAFMDLGIFSLTSDPTNILMWSYYGKNSGFVVQYDIEELKKIFSPSEIILGPFQINYQNKILPIPFDLNNITLIFLYLTNIKSEKWQHEKEWRMIFRREKMYTPGIDIPDPNGLIKNDRKFKVTNKAVKKIILGKNFFDQKEFQKNTSPISIILKDSNNPKSFFYKKSVVDYIIENNIPSEMIGIDPNSFSLNLIKIGFQKTGCLYKYIMNVK
jgi:hypothetical protein